MNLTLVTDTTPDQEPVSLAEAKAYLRQDSTDDDDTIQGLITAARLEAENEQGRECSPKDWILALDDFPRSGYYEFDIEYRADYGIRPYLFRFNRGSVSLLDPLNSVGVPTFKTSDGTVTDLVVNTDFIVDPLKHPGIICPTSGNDWPRSPAGTTGIPWASSAFQIPFNAGFTPDTVPANIKQGIMMLVSQWYEARIPFEAVRFVAEIPFSVTSLFRNNKLWKL